MTHVMNMNEVLYMVIMTTVICMTLFEMSLLLHLDINQYVIT